MQFAYRIAADVVVVLHATYALFVVLALPAIYLGIIRRAAWVRNLKFRLIHLAMILIVVVESWCGITCPLTVLEKQLRQQAGQSAYTGDFLANVVHDLLFFEAEPWVFTVIYSGFGLLVAATFVLAPPRRPCPLQDQSNATP